MLGVLGGGLGVLGWEGGQKGRSFSRNLAFFFYYYKNGVFWGCWGGLGRAWAGFVGKEVGCVWGVVGASWGFHGCGWVGLGGGGGVGLWVGVGVVRAGQTLYQNIKDVPQTSKNRRMDGCGAPRPHSFLALANFLLASQ